MVSSLPILRENAVQELIQMSVWPNGRANWRLRKMLSRLLFNRHIFGEYLVNEINESSHDDSSLLE